MNIKLLVFLLIASLSYPTIQTFTSGTLNLWLTVLFLVVLCVATIALEREHRRRNGLIKKNTAQVVGIILWVILFPNILATAFTNPYIEYLIIAFGTVAFYFLLERCFPSEKPSVEELLGE